MSIILPTYNRRLYLQEAVESVLAQTYPDWELIVVDDGSTDDSVEWISSLTDSRINLLTHSHIGEPAVLRNLGLEAASAPWIAFLDSDDRWKPTKLERQLAYHAANPHVRWSYTGHEMIDASGARQFDPRRRPWAPYSGFIFDAVLNLDTQIALPSVIVERALLEEVGGFDKSRQWVEDYDLWLRLSRREQCGLVDEPLIDIRSHRSTTFNRPETDLGFVSIYRDLARDTMDRELRTAATWRAAFRSVTAVHKLSINGRWREAFLSLIVAWRLRPFRPFVYRTGMRLAWRWIQSASRSRGPVQGG